MIQEIVLSSKGIVICGSHQRGWNDFQNGATLLQSCGFLREDLDDITLLQKVNIYGEARTLDADLRTLGFLLTVFLPGTQVTDPRDRIFGLLGLLPEGPQKSSIHVDYAKPIGKYTKKPSWPSSHLRPIWTF